MHLLGWLEFFIIAILALLIIGPKDLPRFLYKVGQLLGKLKSFASEFQEAFHNLSRLGSLEDIKKDGQTPPDRPSS